MRKPKSTQEIKQNKYYQKASKKKRVEIISSQKEKIKNYNKVQKIELKTNEKITKDWQSTQTKFKGKTRKQISRLIKNYKSRKSTKLEDTQFKTQEILSLDFKELKFKHKENYFTNENFYTISKLNPQQSIEKLVSEQYGKKVNYYLIILEGKDRLTGAKLVVSDSFTPQNIDRLDLTELISMMESRSEGSGANFKLKRIVVRIIYEDSTHTKRQRTKRTT